MNKKTTRIVIVDNYDSFTYNLAHLLRELGAECSVVRNDKFQLAELEPFDKIVLSPGPGIPEEAGLLLDVIRTYAGRKPILGVCLGHQAIGQVFGSQLVNLATVYHGVATPCHLLGGDYLFGRRSARNRHSGPLSLVGGRRRHHSRLFRDNRTQRRGTGDGLAPQAARHQRHTVPPGKHTDTRRKDHAPQLDRALTAIGFGAYRLLS